jgi:hypothetical protein
MFDWLISLLVVVLLLLWILDYLGLLDIVSTLAAGILAVIAGVSTLVAFLLRKLIAAAGISPDRPEPPSSESTRPGYRSRSRGSRRPPTD